MTFRRSMWLVARREITERVRERSFLVSGAVTLLIVAAAAVVPALIGGDDTETYKVGVAGPEQRAVAAAAGAAGQDLQVKIESRRVRDRAQAEQLVRDGDLDAALLEGRVVISDEKLPDELASALQVGQRQVATGATLRRQGLSESATRQVLEPEPLKAETLSGDDDEEQKQFIALAAGILLYMQLLTYGLWVATGVVEEKSSRVVEILLSTLSPRALMAGKIVGLGLLGMGQLLLVVAVGIALALATGSLEPDAGDVSPALLVLLWFPLGYALYASLYAATAALVSRQEDMQSATTPLDDPDPGLVLPVLQRAGGPRRNAGPGDVAGSRSRRRWSCPGGWRWAKPHRWRWRWPCCSSWPPPSSWCGWAPASTRAPSCGPASRSSCCEALRTSE